MEQLAQARERAHVANRLETHLLSRCSERTRCNPCPTWNNCCAIPAATTRRLRRGFAPQTTGRETKALDNKYTLSFGHHSDADEAQPAIELTLTKAQSEFVKGERYAVLASPFTHPEGDPGMAHPRGGLGYAGGWVGQLGCSRAREPGWREWVGGWKNGQLAVR